MISAGRDDRWRVIDMTMGTQPGRLKPAFVPGSSNRARPEGTADSAGELSCGR